jgi:hypothetical protein
MIVTVRRREVMRGEVRVTMIRSRWVVAGRALAGASVLVTAPLLAACSSEEAQRVENGVAVPDDPNQPNEPFAMGDTIQIGDFQLVVHGLTDPFVGTSSETRPTEDDRWVAVDVELTNLDDEAVEVSGWALFEIVDSTRQSYRAIDPQDDTRSINGEIPAGGSRRGTIVFEVARDATGFELFFAGDVFASGSATVALG